MDALSRPGIWLVSLLQLAMSAMRIAVVVQQGEVFEVMDFVHDTCEFEESGYSISV